jgi:hypothetical protein
MEAKMPDDNSQKPGDGQSTPSGSPPKNPKPPNGKDPGSDLAGFPGCTLELDDPGTDKGGGNGHAGDDDAEIARLAYLSPLDFERGAAEAAKRLGCPVGALRRLVALFRRGAADGDGQGRRLELPEIDPWPEPVDGDSLLKAVTDAIRRYVVMGLAEARVVALWTVAAHCFSCFAVFARLFVTAAEKQCGKTTLLDVVSLAGPTAAGCVEHEPGGIVPRHCRGQADLVPR